MRVLIEIVHPANVLFFSRPIRRLLDRGDDVCVVSRHKVLASTLLDAMGVPHTPISVAGTGLLGLGLELLKRDVRMVRIARRFRPHVMIGFGGLAISHAGRLLRIPAISFYDTEQARLQTRLTWPFISHLYVPQTYTGPVPKNRTTRLAGSKDLSFFHPSSFRADREVAIANGFDPACENFLVRFVAWRANHDLGKSGLGADAARALIGHLSSRGKVHVSSERPLPSDLERYRYAGSPLQVHHVLAHCRLYFGESATMACEAALVGTPSAYASTDSLGYVDDLIACGAIRRVRNTDADSLVRHAEEMLAEDRGSTSVARDRWLDGKADWGLAVVEALDRHALRDT
jgi:predicted glycosyltransferase